MKYRIRPTADFYSIERLERKSLFKKQRKQITTVAIFDRRFILPLMPREEKDKIADEKMPATNAQHAVKLLEEIKKADAIVEGKQ